MIKEVKAAWDGYWRGPKASPTGSELQSGAKASAVGKIIAAWQALQPIWSGKNMEAYSREAMRKNPIAYGCITKLSRAAAYIPLNIMQGKKKIEDKNHPLAKLLGKPNPRMTQQQLFESLVGAICLWGNNALELKGSGIDAERLVTADNLPTELWTHRFDLFRIVPATDGTVYGYWYEENGQHFVWKVDPLSQGCNLLHMKTWHPTDRWYGLAPTEAASMGVDQHNEAGAWNQALLQNSARPSGIFTWKPPTAGSTLSPDQRADLRAEVDQMIDSARRKGRPMMLDGEWDYKEMGFSPKDMDWLNGKNVSGREICLCYGVPPYVMGIEDPTYNNITEARAIMYEDSVIPLLDFVLEHFNHAICPLYGEDITIVPDLNKVPALAVRRQTTWTMVQNANWLTTNEKREITGFEKRPEPEADEVLISSNVAPLSTVLEPPADPNAVDENGDPIDPNADPGADDGAKPDPKDKGAKPAIKPKKPGANFEKRLMRGVLQRELGYDSESAKEMADFAYGEKDGDSK